MRQSTLNEFLVREGEFRKFCLKHRIKTVISCFSGGRDSLVATHFAHSQVADIVDFKVLHVDTTIALPGVQDYIREVCDRLGWDLHVVRPERTFEEFIPTHGMPIRTRRWCCYHLKLEPIIKFVRAQEPPRCEVLGLRREESVRRRRLPRHIWKEVSRAWSFCPIMDWSKGDVEAYIRRHELPLNPIYKVLNSSGECVCGAFMTKKQMMIVRGNFPDFYKRFLRIERMLRKGKAFWFGDEVVSAFDIWYQKTLEEVVE